MPILTVGLTANPGSVEASFPGKIGNPGDKPFVGDFNGDGIETIGLHRELPGYVCFRQIHTTGPAHIEYYFRNPGDRLVAGDWGTTDGVDTVAVYRPPQTAFHFRHSNTHGVADAQLTWGVALDSHRRRLRLGVAHARVSGPSLTRGTFSSPAELVGGVAGTVPPWQEGAS